MTTIPLALFYPRIRKLETREHPKVSVRCPTECLVDCQLKDDSFYSVLEALIKDIYYRRYRCIVRGSRRGNKMALGTIMSHLPNRGRHEEIKDGAGGYIIPY